MTPQDRNERPNDPRPYRAAVAADPIKPAKYRPSLSRLGPEQQQLVVLWRPLAFSRARRWTERYPHLADAYQDAATDALHKAALYYDPATGFSFSTLARRLLDQDLANVYQNSRPRGYRRSTSREGVPATSPLGSLVDPAETGRTATDHLEDAEEVGTILARMEPSLAEVLRQRHFERRTLEEMGRERGVTREWIRRIEQRALDQAREIGASLGLAG